MFYFEIMRKNEMIKRGTTCLNTISFSNELMLIPSMQLVLPITYSAYIGVREEIKVYVNERFFHGIVTDYELDKIAETLTVNLSHIIHEWGYRQLPTNLAVKGGTIGQMYALDDFKPSDDWNIAFDGDAEERLIDYVYSRQNQLDALNKTIELTPDLFWRVNFNQGRQLEIGPFGKKMAIMISKQPSGKQNIQIISEPRIRHQFSHVVNVAVVYGEKSDSGMSSMSLREVYHDESLQDVHFPIEIIRENINNERQYDYEYYPELAPNNHFEYAIFDRQSIEMESGIEIEGTFAFNDLSPFSVEVEGDEDSLIITNQDRIDAAFMAYNSAIRKLKQARRFYQIELDVKALPTDLNVGDRVRFIYDHQLLAFSACSKKINDVLGTDEWYFMTRITYNMDAQGMEWSTLTLEKQPRISRESDVQ